MWRRQRGWWLLQGVQGGGLVGSACGPVLAARQVRHTRANQHELAMKLQAIKSAHESVVVGLAGMVQEQPGLGLAGMDLAEICKEYY